MNSLLLTVVASFSVVIIFYIFAFRPWHLRWGATTVEVQRIAPGDELVREPHLQATRAISIQASPDAVWPWLAQMGAYTRAGWYSYDWLDNAGIRSAQQIVPELQGLRIGDVMLTSPTDGFVVEGFEPNRYLVLWLRNHSSSISSTYILDPMDERATRLLVRIRARFGKRLRDVLFHPVFEVGDFVFMRRQLLNVKRRAEAMNKRPRGQRQHFKNDVHTTQSSAQTHRCQTSPATIPPPLKFACTRRRVDAATAARTRISSVGLTRKVRTLFEGHVEAPVRELLGDLAVNTKSVDNRTRSPTGTVVHS